MNRRLAKRSLSAILMTSPQRSLRVNDAVIGACVIGVPDPKVGERIKAIVVTREDVRGVGANDRVNKKPFLELKEERDMEHATTETAKKIWGWNDEQIKGLSSKQQRLIENGNEFRKWMLIAEVFEARNCIAGLKKGDKYIFHASGFLLPEESTCPRICLWALTSFVPFSYMLYDRIGQGDDPSEFWIDRVRCMDVGVERGGYGEVLFRLYCQKC